MSEAVFAKKSRSRLAMETIQAYIVTHRLSVGDRIPTEHELARDLDISRVSIREATKALSLVGVLKSKPKVGTVVGDLDITRLSDLISFHFAVSSYTKQELVQARLIVEVGQLELAMENMTESKYRGLINLARAVEAVEGDREKWLAADLAFHAALLELGANRPIRALAELLRNFFNLAVKQRGRARTDVVNEHQMIVEALHQKNLSLAQGLMRQHLTRYLDPEETAHQETINHG
jgi:GntR family transcriptional repressor for pyruvate dehydrogenase complex